MNSKVNLTILKRELQNLDAEETLITAILNTARTYNKLLDKFNKGEKIQPYILAGYNGQLVNQVMNLKKLKQRNDSIKEKELLKRQKLEAQNAPDEFQTFINQFKKN